MSGRMKVFVGLAFLVLVAGAVSVTVRPPSDRERLRSLTVELRALKDSAEACTAALADGQAGFETYEARIDALRRRIAAIEGILPEGVPGDSYPAYIAAVDSFNAALPAWQPIADSVAATRRTCEARVETHRVMADSVRALAESLGLLDPVPPGGSR